MMIKKNRQTKQMGRFNDRNYSRNKSIPSEARRSILLSKSMERLPADTNSLRIIPLGGMGEIGRNMTVFEYGEDIIVMEMGFRFPEEDMPGIDYIIPNVEYLEGKKDLIRGAFLTHGHYDHIGGIPYIIEKLGYPTIYTTPLTRAIVLRRQEEFSHLGKLDIQIIQPGKEIKLGHFTIEPIHVTHNIPDTVAYYIKTPIGKIFYTGEFKFDPEPVWEKPTDSERIKTIGEEGVLLLISDSTRAEAPGRSIPEKRVGDELEKIFAQAKGRIIAATFASLLTRVQQMITLAEKYNRFVVIQGYSMKTVVEIARMLKYINPKKGTLITPEASLNLSPEKILILCTGAQGEDTAAMMRIATGEHRYFKVLKSDTIIFSSSVIPGNEGTVQIVKDLLYRKGAKIFHYKLMDIHAGGHAQQEELKEMMGLTRPKFFMPNQGHYSMLYTHRELALNEGYSEKNIVVPDNGNVVSLTPDEIKIEKEWVPSSYVMVDGLGIGDIGQVVLRDRQVMAQDGMFTAIAIIDIKTGRVRGNPDIISRGFVYLKESKDLIAQARRIVKDIVESATRESKGQPVNIVYVKDNIREKLGKFLFQKTQRRPMILPVIIEV